MSRAPRRLFEDFSGPGVQGSGSEGSPKGALDSLEVMNDPQEITNLISRVSKKKPQAGDRQGPRRMVSLSQICCWILAYPLPGRSLTFEGLWRSRTFQIPSKLRARALPMQNERPPGRRHIGRGNRSRSCSNGSPENACVTANLLSEKSLVGFPRCRRTARKGVQQAKFRNKVKFHSPV